jgi:hypothetical protein
LFFKEFSCVEDARSSPSAFSSFTDILQNEATGVSGRSELGCDCESEVARLLLVLVPLPAMLLLLSLLKLRSPKLPLVDTVVLENEFRDFIFIVGLKGSADCGGGH